FSPTILTCPYLYFCLSDVIRSSSAAFLKLLALCRVTKTVKLLRTSEFKPFVVFVKPPTMERLRETRKNSKIISSKDDKGSAKPFTVRAPESLSDGTVTVKTKCAHF
ncbi:hypothetical protein CHARACLAT_022683, partial [Characodon lateralis]|nr:hypothetical protein [Characodon lateralis]